MAITFGNPGGSQVTTNFDALFATSLANYKQTLTDNISLSNAFFYELSKSGLWESRDGGAYIAEDLMYEVTPFDSYDAYDEMGDAPSDGMTQVQFQWRQGAVPVIYSEKERKMNKHRLVDLVKSKITQAELGFKQGFKQALLQGSMAQGGVSLSTPYISPYNGSSFIDPLGLIIAFDPTAAGLVGNLEQSTASLSWWRNRTKTYDTVGATTMTSFLQAMDNLYNTCTIGPGGPPRLCLVDQTTYELWNAAYFVRYRTQAVTDEAYPFENIKFRKMKIVWDEDVPDVYSGTTSTATYGTVWMINPDFFKVVYEAETNFAQTDFQKPPKGDSRICHILWMGNVTVNNRRKHGVCGKVSRTLTAS